MRYTRCLGSLNLIALSHYLFSNVIAADDDANHNFGRMYKWRGLREGFDEAKISRKPIFLLVHKPGCPTCDKLRHKFTKSIRILYLSQRFVMVNMRKGEIPAQDETRFEPDGTYVPRILFFTPDGEFMEDIYNRHPEADDKYKYFYSTTAQIIDSMNLALERCSSKESARNLRDRAKKK